MTVFVGTCIEQYINAESCFAYNWDLVIALGAGRTTSLLISCRSVQGTARLKRIAQTSGLARFSWWVFIRSVYARKINNLGQFFG